jgi:putative transposase
MVWFGITTFLTVLVDVFSLRLRKGDKDIEVLLLRQQVRILERKLGQKARINRWEKCLLAVLTVKLIKQSGKIRKQLRDSLLLFKPETVLGWHKALVQRKWTFKQPTRVGRPPTSTELRDLVIRLAQENDWGYDKIKGELQKLGYKLDRTTVKNILKRAGLVPAPERRRSLNWRTFLNHYKQQLLACDFFTVETLGLQTLYVLFFIELGTRRVHLAGCTSNPTSAWVSQQARQLCWQWEERAPFRFLIHDRDSKFTTAFDTVFQSRGIEIIHTAYRAPNMNAFAERWVRSVREECLDRVLIVNERHLRSVLKEYVLYYNTRRPHQGLAQQCPIPIELMPPEGVVQRRDLLGGVLHDYHRQAA